MWTDLWRAGHDCEITDDGKATMSVFLGLRRSSLWRWSRAPLEKALVVEKGMNRESDEREILDRICTKHVKHQARMPSSKPPKPAREPRSCKLFAAYRFTKELIIKRTFLSGWLIRPIQSMRGCLTLVAFQSLALRWHEGQRRMI